jgi:hypothetical protein
MAVDKDVAATLILHGDTLQMDASDGRHTWAGLTGTGWIGGRR